MLATGVSRTHWYVSYLVIAVLGSLAILAVTGLGLGLAAMGTSGDTTVLGAALPAILTYAPAVWVMVGVGVLAVGWAPRATLVAWLLIAYAFVILYLGRLLGLPEWMIDLSPFSHVPAMPVESFSGMPLAVLTLVAAGLIGAGLYGFTRRDIEAT